MAEGGWYGRSTMDQAGIRSIRNVCIVAHIDHGKSTLADRFLELCDAVDPREMRDQFLDSMELERERGITIKLQSVRLDYRDHTVNLIDTPGHVDFGYEVSRSLAACEGVILLVDAAQGIEAQTLANCYLALEADLEIVAAVNKIDLPAADPDRTAAEIERVLGIPSEDVLRLSAKTGDGVGALLDAVIERVPPPTGDEDAPLQALVFDSHFDQYRGVVSSVRVMNGVLATGASLRFMNAAVDHEADEVGVRSPTDTAVVAYRDAEEQFRQLDLTPLATGILARLLRGMPFAQAVTLACEARGVAVDQTVIEGTSHVLANLAARGAVLGAAEPLSPENRDRDQPPFFCWLMGIT